VAVGCQTSLSRNRSRPSVQHNPVRGTLCRVEAYRHNSCGIVPQRSTPARTTASENPRGRNYARRRQELVKSEIPSTPPHTPRAMNRTALTGRYLLTRLLGKGAWSARSWQAFDTTLRRVVCPQDAPPRSRLRRRTAQPISCGGEKNRCPRTSQHRSDSLMPLRNLRACYLVCDYVEGGNLDRANRQKRFDLQGNAPAWSRSCEALHLATGTTLSTAMLSPQYPSWQGRQAFLTDFGLAVSEEETA